MLGRDLSPEGEERHAEFAQAAKIEELDACLRAAKEWQCFEAVCADAAGFNVEDGGRTEERQGAIGGGGH